MQRLFLVFIIACVLVALGALFPPEVIIIEDFESGEAELIPFSDKDVDPDDWAIDSTNTDHNSEFSLKLFGNNWKLLEISPYPIDSNTVWQVSHYVELLKGTHGFGVTDGENVLLYSFAGNDKLDIEEWLTVYQGYYPNEQWNTYRLPIGDDWLAWHRYKPTITDLIFINDNESELYYPAGISYYDSIIDITPTIAESPKVHISYTTFDPKCFEDSVYCLPVQFHSKVFDPNCSRHKYLWNFGDGTLSADMEPAHLYKIGDDHRYTAFLTVENEGGKFGYSSVQVKLPEDDSSLPLTMNFVGDVMLARRYEEPGGIIPMLGVEAIFKPTLHLLGEDADITVINLECPLTTSEELHPTKSIGFKGNPENVKGLIYAGVDVASLANNHILDFMEAGLQETQQVLDEARILHLGAGNNSFEAYLPAFVTKKGVNVAFISSSDRTGQYNNYQPYLDAGYDRAGFALLTPYYVRKQIKSVRNVSDLVVTLIHSGSEYSREPISHYDIDIYAYGEETGLFGSEQGPAVPPMDTPKMWDRDVRHFIIDSGADLVINHHPHVIQGVELYRGKLIAHSLGNFIFDSNYPETMPSMILTAEADKESFTNFTITPIFVDYYIPQEATGELALYILDYLAARSQELDTYLHVDRDNFRASVVMDTLNIIYYGLEQEGTLYFDEYEEDSLYRSQPMRFKRFYNPSELLYIDPVDNYKYRLGRELVWYGNFEDEGASLWNMEQAGLAFDDSLYYAGNRALKLTRNAGSGKLTANMRERVRIFETDKKLTLHGYIKTENAKDVNIELRFYKTRSGTPYLQSDFITTPISGTTDWTYFYKEVDAHVETRTAEIFFHSPAPDSGTSYAWFDNVGIIEWGEWQEYQENAQIDFPNEYYYIQFETENPIEVASLYYLETGFEQGFPPPPPTSTDEKITIAHPKTELYGNYPNPFNAETKITFTLNQAGDVNLTIYNIKGQRVKTLIDEHLDKSPLSSVIWNGKDQDNRDTASGVYFYQLKLNNKVINTKKCILLK